jgi:hypothetical protein
MCCGPLRITHLKWFLLPQKFDLTTKAIAFFQELQTQDGRSIHIPRITSFSDSPLSQLLKFGFCHFFISRTNNSIKSSTRFSPSSISVAGSGTSSSFSSAARSAALS